MLSSQSCLQCKPAHPSQNWRLGWVINMHQYGILCYYTLFHRSMLFHKRLPRARGFTPSKRAEVLSRSEGVDGIAAAICPTETRGEGLHLAPLDVCSRFNIRFGRQKPVFEHWMINSRRSVWGCDPRTLKVTVTWFGFLYCIHPLHFWLETRHRVGGQKHFPQLARTCFSFLQFDSLGVLPLPPYILLFLLRVEATLCLRTSIQINFEKSATFHPEFFGRFKARAKGAILSSLFPTWDSFTLANLLASHLESFKRSLSLCWQNKYFRLCWHDVRCCCHFGRASLYHNWLILITRSLRCHIDPVYLTSPRFVIGALLVSNNAMHQ